jgi:phytoene desaturase
MKKVDIIGAGLSGLYAACYLAKQGHKVRVYEKHDQVGGRGRTFQAEGFTFDMGPSWYWMPELIDDMFSQLGEDRKEYFKLQRLSPSYKVFWPNNESSEIPVEPADLAAMFDGYEQGGGDKLKHFLSDAQTKYETAVPEFLEKSGQKLNEVINFRVLKQAMKLDVFKSVEKDIAKRFTSKKAKDLLGFPVLFLGEMPSRIPSLYTLMNYADMGLGTWYPEGGMSAIARTLEKIAIKLGVEFHFNADVQALVCEKNQVIGLKVDEEVIVTDHVIGSADYHFIEQNLVPKKYRRYSESYWDSRSMAPSSLIFYLGVKGTVANLEHHNLFFDEDLTEHGKTIYEQPRWPEKPLFYVCAPTKTDKEVAPENCENLFILMPIAPDLEDSEEMREYYYDLIMKRLEDRCGVKIKENILYKKSYCLTDFKEDYNSYKGNAYGLANTLKQTANLKPKMRSKLTNLVYCGQLTVPGPGVPPALVSGKNAAKLIMEEL